MCTGNVIWRGKAVQRCTCLKWVHLRCSQFSLSKFRTLELPPAVTPSDMYTSIVHSSPLCWCCTFASPSSSNLLSPSAYSVSAPSPQPLAVLLRLQLSLPLALSGFFTGMLEVFEPEALNYFTIFRSTLLTLFVSSNPILTDLPDSWILSRDASHASDGVIIFVRQGLSFSELSTASLSSFDP